MGYRDTSVENNDEILLQVGDESAWHVVDTVRRTLGCHVRPILCEPEEVLAQINQGYQIHNRSADSAVAKLKDEELDPRKLSFLDHRDDLLDDSHQTPVIKLVNSFLFDAIEARASDIHIQPRENELVVRQRIDGVLFQTLTIPKEHQEEVISRLKVLGKMNIAEKRLPQDGRASVQVGDRVIDLRLAALPTSFGERIVVRFLDKSARLYTLEELGMGENGLKRFRRLIQLEHGLLLVTGPTGSGKSTTLYAALQEINVADLNVLTLEDPIEYQLEGISQTQINTKKGLTFASGLRNVLRQDPDIIMVGEIRDRETAEMAIQSALTGHLVFSTLHTNDAASAVTRLIDLGIEPFLVASSVIAVMAQRLVRRICPECKQPQEAMLVDKQSLGLADDYELSAWRGAGCKNCRDTGHHGRVGIYEIMEVGDELGELIQERANASEIRQRAMQAGMQRLLDDGVYKIQTGQTTIDEVLRVTMRAVETQSE
ncbi:MAG: Flp pilus assembly complex ATPase component TadA [Planctomycetales bacterium]|nr:Flp pilus assembly complex ATPase component TadA [Planctomycetales bacterium]